MDDSGSVIKSSIVTAFTIAVALIWKDVIANALDQLIPRGDRLSAQFLTAIVATALVIVAIKVFVRTEERAEEVIEDLGHLWERKNHGPESGRRKGGGEG